MGNLRAFWGVLITVVALMSGILSIVQEILQFVDPAKFPEKPVFFASLRVAFLVAIGLMWWQEKRARIVAETLLDKSKPHFELQLGDIVWQYRAQDNLTLFYLLASILNRGEQSVSLNWKARYILNGIEEPMVFFQIIDALTVNVAQKQVTFTNENLTNIKTLESPIQKGQWVGGRILCTVPGDRSEQIKAAQYRIEVECTDYAGAKAAATYLPSPAPPRVFLQHYSEKTRPLPDMSGDAGTGVSQ